MSKHWIDDADHWICPDCGFITPNPNKYEGAKCPKCGFQDEKDKAKSERVTMTVDKYKKVAMDLLAEYLESEQAVISEYSGNFKMSAMILKEQVMKYLERLDEGENTFNELVKDMWIANYYKAESEVEE